MIRKGRMLATALAAVASAVLCAPLVVAPPATAAPATTGDTYVLPPSQYVLPPAVMSQYYGSYHMTSVAPASRLTTADIFITTNSWGDLYGGGDFYGYDDTGAQTSWTNLLYDFHLAAPSGAVLTPAPWTTPGQVSGDRLTITLYGWGSPSLGTLSLTRKPNGDLTGSIRLFGQTRSYPVTFHRTGPATAPSD